MVEDINKNNGHLTTGIVGTYCLLPVLNQQGQGSVAFTIANQSTYPRCVCLLTADCPMSTNGLLGSWGYMIVNPYEPATTLWYLFLLFAVLPLVVERGCFRELWNTPDGDPSMDSRDHVMFGSIE